MDKSSIQQKWLAAQNIDKELQLQLNKDLPTFENIEHLITQLRIACEAVIFCDFEYGTNERVQHRLWDAHSLINTRYRKLVAHYRSADQKRRVVERRKLEKHYVDFLKTSQFFYKGYIQRLSSHFGPLPALQRIANRLSLSPLTVDKQITVGQLAQHLIKMSCHFTLLRLGDLSRYRNDLRTKDRSWEPALGYYSLADALYPDSGSAHNQMAVIALAEGSHLNALYHLLRAVAVEEPHELARGNLAIEYKKISSGWEKEKHSKRRSALSESALVIWFVRLQAKFYKGVAFSEHAELEREVLGQLARALKDQTFEETLNKLVLVNIAASFLAEERITEQKGGTLTEELKRSFYYVLGFNLQVFCVLLQTLISELADAAEAENLESLTATESSGDSFEKLSAVAVRVLPAIRQYFAWIISQRQVIVGLGAGVVDSAATGSLIGHIQKMWSVAADTLTALATVFPVASLPCLNYLLPEDEETIGFKPLRKLTTDSKQYNLYSQENGSPKFRIVDGVLRQPYNENYARVRDILRAGVALYHEEGCPITLTRDGHFTYTIGTMSPASDSSALPTPLVEPTYAVRNHRVVANGRASVESLDTDMHRMVDDLLEPASKHTQAHESSYGTHNSNSKEVLAPIGSERAQKPVVNQITPTKAFPSLPGIWNNAFTPKPNELRRTSPDRLTSSAGFSSMSFSSNKDQLAAAAALDNMTGRWPTISTHRKKLSTSSSETSASVNQLLQQSLAQQFGPMSISSSNFSANSSIYANTSPPKAYYNRTVAGVTTNSPNESTIYPGASDFEGTTMLQNSFWNGNQAAKDRYEHTSPAGQGRPR